MLTSRVLDISRESHIYSIKDNYMSNVDTILNTISKLYPESKFEFKPICVDRKLDLFVLELYDRGIDCGISIPDSTNLFSQDGFEHILSQLVNYLKDNE